MKKVDYYKFCLLHLKMGQTTYYQKSRETILNRAKDYYENNKDVLREKAKSKCRELSEEKKNIKENMEEVNIIIYMKKRNKDGRNISETLY